MAGLRACAAFVFFLPGIAGAEQIPVAVASNFRAAFQHLETVFEVSRGHEVSASYGSTGKHYAQIINGAPFVLFLAADAERPRRLAADRPALAGSRFTYAIGKLVLWYPGGVNTHQGDKVLLDGEFRFLAIANPRTAPYGRAAEQVLANLNALERLQSRLVRGENIAQAFAYVSSGNADMGLLALSQMSQSPDIPQGSFWIVPQELYDPIEQQAVLLKDTPGARSFLEFLGGPEAQSIIVDHGYALP